MGKPKGEAKTIWITRMECARRFKVTPIVITRYCARGAPSREDKRVPWPAIKEWRDRNIIPERSGSWAHRQRVREEAGERAGQGAGRQAAQRAGQEGGQGTGQGTGQRINPVGATATKAAESTASEPAGSPAAGSPVGSVPGMAAGTAAPKVNGHAAAQYESLAQATVRDKIAAANIRELEYRQRNGELIETERVKLWIGNMVVEARDGIMRVPAEYRDRLAAESDPVKVEEMLDGALRRVLERLAEKAREAPKPT